MAEQPLAHTALGLAAGLFLLSLRMPGAVAPGCPTPRELAARGAVSAAASCGGDARGRALRGPARLLFGQRLDLNRARAGTLEVLPGIGPARAAAILAERRRRPFASVDELLRVPGIGPHTLVRLRPYLDVPPR